MMKIEFESITKEKPKKLLIGVNNDFCKCGPAYRMYFTMKMGVPVCTVCDKPKITI